jgi:glutamate-1-semialdehyde 2,1-aminomutase
MNLDEKMNQKLKKSSEQYERACKVIAGGVSSGARSYPYPFLVKRAQGSKIYDVDGNKYIDYALAYGPLILGHGHPSIIEAVKEQMNIGYCYGATHEQEIKLAEKLKRVVPSAELVRFCCSGTEAMIAAIRLARAYTGRKKIVKFEGHYHGGYDPLLTNTVIPPDHLVPFSWGIPSEALANTILLPWNDLQILEKTMKGHAHELAAVITEPYLCNSGCIPPKEGYLEGMRDLTEKYNVPLVFDEVITGFRLSLGGAQEYFHVTPDISIFAKGMAGGLPIGTFVGKEEIMKLVAEGKSFHGGTFNSNPVCVAAALAVINVLEKGGIQHINDLAKKLIEGLRDIFEMAGVNTCIQGPGSIWTVFFTEKKSITNYRQAVTVDKEKFIKFWKLLLLGGIWTIPNYLQHAFISTQHTKEDVQQTLTLVENFARKLKE